MQISSAFLRLFEERDERQLVKNVKLLTAELQKQEAANAIMPLTERKDMLGGVAHRSGTCVPAPLTAGSYRASPVRRPARPALLSQATSESAKL